MKKEHVDRLTLHECAERLHKIASFLETKHWDKVVTGRHSVFGEHLDTLFDKLEDALNYQVVQVLDMRWPEAAKVGVLTTSKELPAKIRELADSLELKSGREIPAVNKKVSLPRGSKPEQLAGLLLDRAETRNLNTSIVSNFPPGADCGFYVRNAVDSLSCYVEALHTIANGVPDKPWFNAILESTLKNPEYYTNGYPHDILVHDVRDISSKDNQPYGLSIHKDWASSHVLEDPDSKAIEGHVIYKNPDWKPAITSSPFQVNKSNNRTMTFEA
jgi:hypothetical protein